MVGRCLVALMCLAGCDQLFKLSHVDKLPPDAPIDARPDSAIDGLPYMCPPTYDLHFPQYSPAYRYESVATMWDVAEALCEADTAGHTHLVVLDDDTERTALIAALLQRQVTMPVWIGFSDRRFEGAFRWVTDQPVGIPPQQNPPWPPGQPDNLGGAQDCVRIQGGTDPSPGLFDDKECSFYERYVCECDAWPADPNNF